MAKFKLGCRVTVSAYTEIEAETGEEAIAEAKGRYVAIGGLHSGVGRDEAWIIDEADGEATDIYVESSKVERGE